MAHMQTDEFGYCAKHPLDWDANCIQCRTDKRQVDQEIDELLMEDEYYGQN